MRTNVFGIASNRLIYLALSVLVLAAIVVVGSTRAVAADKVDFPIKGKAITIIVPFGAGGSTDVGARNLAPFIEKALGVPVEVVNKPGAGSQIGITAALSEKPDGYTIFMANLPGPITIYLNPDRKSTFKSKKDFTFLGMQLIDPGAIAVQADGPYKNIGDLVKAAKAGPGKLRAATTGLLSDDHIAILDVEKNAGVKFAVVHFDSNPERDTQLMGGKIDASFGNAGSFYAPHTNNKVRIIGIMDSKRWPKLPDIPTFESLGYKIYQASGRGLFAPPGLNPAIRDILAEAIRKGVTDPEHAKRMEAAGFPVSYASPAEHEKYWDRVEATITPIFKEAYAESKK
jgi:tripartite-type tricarboxylate transporter receptor subunit TctC